MVDTCDILPPYLKHCRWDSSTTSYFLVKIVGDNNKQTDEYNSSSSDGQKKPDAGGIDVETDMLERGDHA
jgi:hypothetical protein